MAYTAVTGPDSASWYPSGSSVARHINARLCYEIATNDATTYKVNFYGEGSVYKDNLGTTMYGKLYQNGNQIGATGSKTYTYSSSGSNHTGVYHLLVNTQTVTITKNHGNQILRVGAKAYRNGAEDSTYSYAYKDLTIGPKPSYTVSYNANGGTGAPAAQTKWHNETLTLQSNEPTRTGHTFQGWATSSTGGVAYRASAAYTSNAGITLYAVWTANTVTINQYANDGSQDHPDETTPIPPEPFTRTYNNTINLWNIGTFKLYKTGYHVDAKAQWNTAANGSGTSYDEDYDYSWATFGNIGAATKTVNLYANWKPNEYQVVYNANGGSGSMSNSKHKYDIAQNLSANTFTKVGYNFNGWNTSIDGSGTHYNDKVSVSNLTSIHNGEVNLYAQWEPHVYSINYDYDGGEKPSISEEEDYPPTEYTYAVGTANFNNDNEDYIPHKKNYKFIGWKDKATSILTTEIYNTTDNSDKEFLACWESTYTPWEFINITCKRASGNSYATMIEDDNGTLPYITILWHPGIDKYPPSKKINPNNNKNIVVNPTHYNLTITDRETNSQSQTLNGEITNLNYYTIIGSQIQELYIESGGANDPEIYFYYESEGTREYIEDLSSIWVKWIINPFYTSIDENDNLTEQQLTLQELNSYRIDLNLSISYDDAENNTYTQIGRTVNDVISATFFIIDINTNGTSIGFGIGTKDDDSLESGIFNNMNVTYQKDIYLYVDTNAGGSYSDSLIKMGLDRLGWWSGNQSNELANNSSGE